METLLTGTDLVKSIYESHKDNFKTGFHNLLWQLVINQTWKDNNVHCFTPVYHDGGQMIAIAENNKSGYHPTYCFFNDDIPYNKAGAILDMINQELFGLSMIASAEIIASSMRKRQPKKGN